MDESITKRLIISGLTPSITAEDISRRLTTFGTVKAADGFGLPDAVGNQRTFGYVTLDTTVGKLAKCMNLLSGSTWKGAKLRFGEAKPDFKERILLENKKAAEEPPKKKRKRFGGVEAEDMTPITPENVAEHPGWKISGLGRITKPVKMRPAHPLPEMIEDKERTKKKPGVVKFSDVKQGGEEGEKKKKKRVKDPDTRARRKVIDMAKYGSTHLKGMFLDLDVPMPTTLPERYQDKRPANEEIHTDFNSEDSDDETSPAKSKKSSAQPIVHSKKNDVTPIAGPSKPEATSVSLKYPPPESEPTHTPISALIPVPTPTSIPAPPLAPKVKPTKSHKIPTTSERSPPPSSDAAVDIQKEKAQSLNLLNSLFGSNDDDDWVGQEDVDSDIDVSELVKGDRMLVDDDEPSFEVVPINAPIKKVLSVPSPRESESEEEEEEEGHAKADEKMDTAPQSKSNQETNSKPKTLKDLFAPREEEAGFSLLSHLDLDIELDEDPLTAESSTQQPEIYESQPAPLPTTITLQTHPSQAPLVLEPRQALFFPLPRQDGYNNIRARQRDVFDLSKDNGWNWRDLSVGFYRTGTEEDIKKRWENSKGELTKDWKRRCREAGKVNRRKRGGVEGDNEY